MGWLHRRDFIVADVPVHTAHPHSTTHWTQQIIESVSPSDAGGQLWNPTVMKQHDSILTSISELSWRGTLLE